MRDMNGVSLEQDRELTHEELKELFQPVTFTGGWVAFHNSFSRRVCLTMLAGRGWDSAKEEWEGQVAAEKEIMQLQQWLEEEKEEREAGGISPYQLQLEIDDLAR